MKVENSLTKKAAENNWVLLYDKGVPDSLIFKTNPSYVSKTDKDGVADFNNLINGQYKIISLSGDDYIYHEDDIIYHIGFACNQLGISNEEGLIDIVSNSKISDDRINGIKQKIAKLKLFPKIEVDSDSNLIFKAIHLCV